MTDEPEFEAWLRSVVPPIHGAAPSADVWPRVVERCERPWTWSWIDAALAGATAAMALVRPDLLLLLAYHI